MASHLTALPAVQRLSPRCIRILAGNPGKFTLQGTNTYLLGSGERRILIDTGEGRPVWTSRLQSLLAEEQAVVAFALVSHWHHDHTGGIADLLSLAPGVAIHKFDPGSGQLAIEDGQEFKVEGATLTAVHTPGHTRDHAVFVLEEEDAMFTADNVLGHGTAVFEDMAEYLHSLAKMRDLFSGRIYPGHGPVLEDGPTRILEYIQHRQRRINQVVRTMKEAQGSNAQRTVWSAMDLVKVIYCEVDAGLHPAACIGMKQILNKLSQDGMIVRHGDEQWQLVQERLAL